MNPRRICAARPEARLNRSPPQAAGIRVSARTRSFHADDPALWDRVRTSRTLLPTDKAVALDLADGQARLPATLRRHIPRSGETTGGPDRIRTCDLPLRRRSLYPLSYGAVADLVAAKPRRFKGGGADPGSFAALLCANTWNAPVKGDMQTEYPRSRSEQ